MSPKYWDFLSGAGTRILTTTGTRWEIALGLVFNFNNHLLGVMQLNWLPFFPLYTHWKVSTFWPFLDYTVRPSGPLSRVVMLWSVPIYETLLHMLIGASNLTHRQPHQVFVVSDPARSETIYYLVLTSNRGEPMVFWVVCYWFIGGESGYLAEVALWERCRL